MKKIDNTYFKYFLVAIENSPEAVYFVDKERKILLWNKKAEEITGYRSEEVVNHYCNDNILQHSDADGKNLCMGFCPLVDSIKKGVPIYSKVYLRTKFGARIPVDIEVYPVFNEKNEVIGAIEYFSEEIGLKEIRQRIRELERKAYLDELTKIPNRRMFEISLNKFFKKFRETNVPFGLVFLDLDNFKLINDQYGHIFGDAALKVVAETLISNIKPNDIAARYGGDEFVILLEKINRKELKSFCKKLDALIKASAFKYKGTFIPVSASIGATIVNKSDNKRSLINRADELMLKAKASKKARPLVEV
ncbi:MAG: sensor domain-containing diguanylate cyclase [Actinobacteria bacterium]|nr:sensor domain-containing diguanylate cyclase [Actinomycetota bacterium]